MTARRPKGEGSFSRGPNGRWEGRLWTTDPTTGKRQRVSVSGRTKTEAATRLKALRERIDRGQPARDAAMTLADFAREWLTTTLPASNRKVTTQQLYAGLATNHLVPSDLARLGLDKIRPSTVERFVAQLRDKGLSDSTVRQIYTIGRAIGDAAVRDGLLADNPFARVPRPAVRYREATHLEPGQVYQLLTAAKHSRYRPLFDLMVNTGLRRGEALALQWRDVDLGAGTLYVRGTLARIDGELQVVEPKSTTSRRHVPLSDAARRILTGLATRLADERTVAADSWVETGFVFTTDLGEPSDPRNALRALNVAAKQAGLKDVSLHTLRHSAASVMLASGIPIMVVSRILGHSGIEITVDIYGHLTPQVSQEAVRALSEALGRAVPEAEVIDAGGDDPDAGDAPDDRADDVSRRTSGEDPGHDPGRHPGPAPEKDPREDQD